MTGGGRPTHLKGHTRAAPAPSQPPLGPLGRPALWCPRVPPQRALTGRQEKPASPSVSQCLPGPLPSPVPPPTLPPSPAPLLTAPLPSARAPELFPEGAQRMRELAPKVGLNPSQGVLLPKSGEHHLLAAQRCRGRRTPDPDWGLGACGRPQGSLLRRWTHNRRARGGRRGSQAGEGLGPSGKGPGPLPRGGGEGAPGVSSGPALFHRPVRGGPGLGDGEHSCPAPRSPGRPRPPWAGRSGRGASSTPAGPQRRSWSPAVMAAPAAQSSRSSCLSTPPPAQ